MQKLVNLISQTSTHLENDHVIEVLRRISVIGYLESLYPMSLKIATSRSTVSL